MSEHWSAELCGGEPSPRASRHPLSGGAGNDVLSFSQSTAASSTFLWPSVLDGGFGPQDGCAVGGANPPHARTCEL